jgi:CheY-like chemotaxis protein
MSKKGILQVEDDENEVFLLRKVLEHAGIASALHAVTDGQVAIDYLDGKGEFADRQKYPLPSLVVTDLNLPRKNGLEVLQWIRDQPSLNKLEVVLFSGSALRKDMDRAYELGAKACLEKTSDPVKLKQIAQLFKEWWLDHKDIAAIVESAGLGLGRHERANSIARAQCR